MEKSLQVSADTVLTCQGGFGNTPFIFSLDCVSQGDVFCVGSVLSYNKEE